MAGKAGWQIRPQPDTLLRHGRAGQPALTWPGIAQRHVPVQAVRAEPLAGPPGARDRGRVSNITLDSLIALHGLGDFRRDNAPVNFS